MQAYADEIKSFIDAVENDKETVVNIDDGLNFGLSIINALAAGIGFMLAMILFAGVRSKLDTADVPEFLKGLPITLIAAALVALSFLGFAGIGG